jgi:hypothetical protein
VGSEVNIQDYERKVFSQFGEDGITLELVRRLWPPRQFAEIGCGDGSENCTRVLLEQGWEGLWIDASPENVSKAIQINPASMCEMVTVDKPVYDSGNDLGVLSIDVDGNDYWLWEALSPKLRPWVVIIEAQTCRPDDGYVMPYDPGYVWDHASRDCGATPSALEALGRRLGYTSLGRLAEKHSPNMFFVRDDLMERLDNVSRTTAAP